MRRRGFWSTVLNVIAAQTRSHPSPLYFVTFFHSFQRLLSASETPLIFYNVELTFRIINVFILSSLSDVCATRVRVPCRPPSNKTPNLFFCKDLGIIIPTPALQMESVVASLWSSFCSLSSPPDAAAAAVARAIDLISHAAIKQARTA
jgi:hypothetical protein